MIDFVNANRDGSVPQLNIPKYRKTLNISPELIDILKHILGAYIRDGLHSEGILC